MRDRHLGVPPWKEILQRLDDIVENGLYKEGAAQVPLHAKITVQTLMNGLRKSVTDLEFHLLLPLYRCTHIGVLVRLSVLTHEGAPFRLLLESLAEEKFQKKNSKGEEASLSSLRACDFLWSSALGGIDTESS